MVLFDGLNGFPFGMSAAGLLSFLSFIRSQSYGDDVDNKVSAFCTAVLPTEARVDHATGTCSPLCRF